MRFLVLAAALAVFPSLAAAQAQPAPAPAATPTPAAVVAVDPAQAVAPKNEGRRAARRAEAFRKFGSPKSGQGWKTPGREMDLEVAKMRNGFGEQNVMRHRSQ